MRKINFRKILRNLLVILKIIFRKLIGILVFLVFATIEVSDWLSLMSAFGSKDSSHRTAGLNPDFVNIYLIVLTILAMGILLLACQTIVGILRGVAWAEHTAQAMAVLFILYGGFQIYSASQNPGMETVKVIISGIVFMIIGLAGFGLGSHLIRA